jgi:hypothetical protein
MNHEIDIAEQAALSGQRRIPKQLAIEHHIAQYEVRSTSTFRDESIAEIVNKLHIPVNVVPNQDKDGVNITNMLLRSNRSDLALQMWTNPEEFKVSHPDLIQIGLKRIDVELHNQNESKNGKKIIKRWKHALKALERT